MFLANEQNVMITLQLLVQNKNWLVKLPPYESIEIPSFDHYKVLMPYIKEFGLVLYDINTEELPVEENRVIESYPDRHPYKQEPDRILTEIERIKEYPGKEPDYLLLDAMRLFEEHEEKENQATLQEYKSTISLKTKAQLRDICSDLELDTKGNKEELTKRILTAKGLKE